MKLLVCGGRDFEDRDMLTRALDKFAAHNRVDIVIHGDARGADHMARDWAIARAIHHAAVPALWGVHKYGAGPIRNKAMLHLQPDMVMAFPGGPGTASMVRLAQEAKILVVGPNP